MRFVYLLLILALVSSCEKLFPNEEPMPVLPPNDFIFQITKANTYLSNSELDSLKMFYIDNNGDKIYRQSSNLQFPEHINLPSQMGFGQYLDDSGVRLNYFLPGAATYHNINQWYFEYGNGDIDTLYVETKDLDGKEGMLHECYCRTPITKVIFNGVDAQKHATLTADNGEPIYVLEKE